jgi:SAM-dependent methyltransferase
MQENIAMQRNFDTDLLASVRKDTGMRHQKKYANKNPIHQLVLGRFFNIVADEIGSISRGNVLDFGCGEGLLLQELKKRNIYFESLLGIDIREDALEQARSLHPDYLFEKKDILQWDCKPKSFDLIIASEVLEHLIEPERVMVRITELCRKDILLTVPWEPWFRLMNLLRGRDIRHFGNHPEHVNLWAFNEFLRFVNKYASVKNARISFPFIIVTASTG